MAPQSNQLVADASPVGSNQPAAQAAAQLPLPGQRETSVGITLGLVAAAVFFLAAWLYPIGWVNRYLLGHPVSVVSVLLFSLVCGMLVAKLRWVRTDARLTRSLRDQDLAVTMPVNLPEADQWLMRADAGRVAKYWLLSLADLPTAARHGQLVQRLSELLQRQSERTSTRQLPDEIRELAMRDSDRAHDSLQLNRIIVWSIPMLGFLGTVIGITQTLGGIDFSSGTAAIEDLKAGLYVAFDTTAVALVLSVAAIFLQYPVERSEQSLLSEIDHRVARLLSSCLPADDRGENPAAHIAELCDGLRVAVGQSLASQAELWRSTIDEAHHHWQRVADDNSQRIAAALSTSLAPLLQTHSQQLSAVLQSHAQAVQAQVQSWQTQQSRDETQQAQHWQQWHTAYENGVQTIVERQASLQQALQQSLESSLEKSLDTQVLRLASLETLMQTTVQAQADDLAQRKREQKQQLKLDAQRRAEETREALDVQAPLSDAMLALARAVDVLGQQLPANSRHLVKTPLAAQVESTSANTIPLARRAA